MDITYYLCLSLSVIDMDANSTVLRTPQGSSNSPPSSDQPSDQNSRKSAKSFSFDHCFDSMNKTTGNYIRSFLYQKAVIPTFNTSF